MIGLHCYSIVVMPSACPSLVVMMMMMMILIISNIIIIVIIIIITITIWRDCSVDLTSMVLHYPVDIYDSGTVNRI